MDATVIICTRNRANGLLRTLSSIDADRSGTACNIVVVDNGSSDGAHEVLKKATSRRPICVVSEPRMGQAHARNAGVAAASGSLLLFTDDDVIVRDNWIDALVQAFEPGVDAVGGRILPVLTGARPAWMGDNFQRAFPGLTLRDRGPEPYVMVGDDYPTGANMAVRRELAVANPFDPRFGHTGNASFAYDEAEMLRRARGRYVYRPEAVVEHRVDLDAWTFADARRKCFQIGMGGARYDYLVGGAPGILRSAVRVARTYSRALVLSASHNGARTPEQSVLELAAYVQAGRHIESLLGRWPTVARFAATRLA